MNTFHSPVPRFKAAISPITEIARFVDGGMTDAEFAQYARSTTKRPLLCFAILVASPFIAEGICRLMDKW